MNYRDLLENSLSQESAKPFTINKTIVEIDDERNGESIISEGIKRELDSRKINYIINPHKLPHPKQLKNAIVDGVYYEEIDTNKRRASDRKIKIIYDDTVNDSNGVTAYVVPSEELAESMESAGLTVLRTVGDVVKYILQE